MTVRLQFDTGDRGEWIRGVVAYSHESGVVVMTTRDDEGCERIRAHSDVWRVEIVDGDAERGAVA